MTVTIRSVPELGPMLGRMASPAPRGPAALPLDDFRFDLLSALYVRAGWHEANSRLAALTWPGSSSPGKPGSPPGATPPAGSRRTPEEVRAHAGTLGEVLGREVAWEETAAAWRVAIA